MQYSVFKALVVRQSNPIPGRVERSLFPQRPACPSDLTSFLTNEYRELIPVGEQRLWSKS